MFERWRRPLPPDPPVVHPTVHPPDIPLDDWKITVTLNEKGDQVSMNGYLPTWDREAHLGVLYAILDGLDRGGFKPVLTVQTDEVIDRRDLT